MNDLLDVEQQALVAAEDQPGERDPRADRAQVEAAHAVLAAEEQLLENRQRRGCRRTVWMYSSCPRTPSDIRLFCLRNARRLRPSA